MLTQRVAAFTAGASLGLLLGLLLGLAAAPVVGAVVGALTALIGGVLGLSDVGTGSGAPGTVLDRRLGTTGFGLACVAGLIVGLNLRVKDAFAKTPVERVTEWRLAGYDSSAARDIVSLQVLGLVPPGRAVQTPLTTGQNTALRSASSDYCETVSPGRVGDLQSFETELRKQAGLLQPLQAAAGAIADTAVRRRVLTAGYEAVCPAHN